MKSIRVALEKQQVLHALFKQGASNDCVILIHGADRTFQNAQHWSQHYNFFSKHYSVYAVDMLGHGESEPGASADLPSPISPEDQVVALKALLDQHRQQSQTAKFVLVGRSYGGSIVTRLAKALEGGNYLKGLIFIAPAATKDLVHVLPKNNYPVMTVWAKDDVVVSQDKAQFYADHFERYTPLLFEQIATDEIKERGELWRTHSPENQKVEEFQQAVSDFLNKL